MSVDEPIVQIVRLDPELPLPRYAHPGDAGADLCTAIDAVLAAHRGAIVVDVDRDDAETYDVDVVRGGEVVELEVGPDGTVREEEREGVDVERGDSVPGRVLEGL